MERVPQFDRDSGRDDKKEAKLSASELAALMKNAEREKLGGRPEGLAHTPEQLDALREALVRAKKENPPHI